MTGTLALALDLAENHGLPVFPCRPDKTPYTEHGFKDASASIERIAELFEAHPDALIGVPTGRASNLLVVDIDPDGAGWYSENSERLACGRIHRTRRGHHLLYRMPAQEIRSSVNRPVPGVDIRAEGGYIVWWPAHGLEAVHDIEDIGASPAWLLEQLAASAMPNASAVVDATEIGAGGRNDYLSREAYRLRKQGAAVEQIVPVLSAMNTARCQPPLADAEVRGIAAGKHRVVPQDERPIDAAPQRAPLDWTDLEGKEPPPRKWIVPHWIPDEHLTLLAGRPGVGKTLIAQHIGAALALGVEYMEPLEASRVLMWAGEDDDAELWRRQLEISSYLGAPLSALKDRFFLHSYAGADLTLAAPVFGKLETTPLLQELRQQVADYHARIVIVDNIARVYGGSENDRHSVTTFLAWLQAACAPAAVLLLGHPAKAAGSEFSGSTAWEGAVRARLYLSDRPPDADQGDDDAPIDDRVRYLSRRKANYSPLDVRRFTMADGVLIPDKPDLARSAKPSGEFAKDIVRRAVRKLAERDIYGTHGASSPNHLPKLARQYNLLETTDYKSFTAAMRAMQMAGELASERVGQYANRAPKLGLVLK